MKLHSDDICAGVAESLDKVAATFEALRPAIADRPAPAARFDEALQTVKQEAERWRNTIGT
jgi:hypothetical protein